MIVRPSCLALVKMTIAPWYQLIRRLCVFHVAKKNIRLNPSDLVDRLAKFISGRIEEKRQLGMKLKSVIEKDYEEYKTVNEHRITNLKEIAPKQCCRYDGHTRYSTEFQRWVNTRSVISYSMHYSVLPLPMIVSSTEGKKYWPFAKFFHLCFRAAGLGQVKLRRWVVLVVFLFVFNKRFHLLLYIVITVQSFQTYSLEVDLSTAIKKHQKMVYTLFSWIIKEMKEKSRKIHFS